MDDPKGAHKVKVNIRQWMKYPSQAFEHFGAFDFCDDEDIKACIEEVIEINEEANFKELPLDEPTLELKTLPSILKYAFLDKQEAKTMIISS